MFSATCSHCNQSCEVPFRPNGDKPVYCSACFGQKSSESSRESNGGGNHFDRGRNNDNRKERTDFTRPSVDRSQSDRELGEIKRQLITIEARLNRILDLINPPMPAVKATNAPAVTINDEVSAIKVAKVKKAVKKAVTKTVKAKKVVTKKPAKKVAKKVAKKSTK
ncbi:MAG: CxxC-x17-CxxC domain-containing protein [Candidatus Paceibacterota bacterium]